MQENERGKKLMEQNTIGNSRTVLEVFESRMRFLPQIHRVYSELRKTGFDIKVTELDVKSVAMASTGGSQYYCGNCGDFRSAVEEFAEIFECSSAIVDEAFTVKDCEAKTRKIRFELNADLVIFARSQHRARKWNLETAIRYASRVGVMNVSPAISVEHPKEITAQHMEGFINLESVQMRTAIYFLSVYGPEKQQELLKMACHYYWKNGVRDAELRAMRTITHRNRLVRAGHALT